MPSSPATTVSLSRSALGAKLLFVLLWSAGFPVAKLAVQYSPRLTLLALRYGFALCVLIVLFATTRAALPRNLKAWAHLGVTGFLVQGRLLPVHLLDIDVQHVAPPVIGRM
jgi:drug/metabolite transporter (DMT)-like permease